MTSAAIAALVPCAGGPDATMTASPR